MLMTSLVLTAAVNGEPTEGEEFKFIGPDVAGKDIGGLHLLEKARKLREGSWLVVLVTASTDCPYCSDALQRFDRIAEKDEGKDMDSRYLRYLADRGDYMVRLLSMQKHLPALYIFTKGKYWLWTKYREYGSLKEALIELIEEQGNHGKEMPEHLQSLQEEWMEDLWEIIEIMKKEFGQKPVVFSFLMLILIAILTLTFINIYQMCKGRQFLDELVAEDETNRPLKKRRAKAPTASQTREKKEK